VTTTNSNGRVRAAVLAVACGLACAALITPATSAHGERRGRSLSADDFAQHAPRGFGDRNNSWAQSMEWWHGRLFVGTTRQSLCGSLFALWEFAGGLLGLDFVNTYLPYPPRSTEIVCAPDGADLSLQAEIWSWTPGDDAWTRVFQSPLDLDNPGPGGGAPPRVGKKLPYEIAVRGMASHVDPDGTEALYAFGANSTVMWDRSKLPPPRILRTTDGVTFEPVPQTPGTFLGDLPFNPDHSSFRSPVSFREKLFVLSGPIFGQGSLIGSADPAQGDDAWFLAAPAELQFYEMAVLGDWLYLGTFNPFGGGYAVVKTRAEGPPPYPLVTVVPDGAFLLERPSRSVVSMHVYNGQLYVGTATQTEVIRINPDDTWDLVVGPPRLVASDGGSEWKYPTSGLDAGFGHSLNDHAWQMAESDSSLYIGTYNAAIGSKNDPVNGPVLAHNMGGHLYRTRDGWYYSAVTTNGFANPADPLGGPNDFGIRTMASTPKGLFLGTANDNYGLAIFRAVPHRSDEPDAPERLDVEPTKTGGALLSWREAKGADEYQVWRAEVRGILVRDDLNFEGWNGITGNKIPDTYVGPYAQIGITDTPYFVDATARAGARYMYYVLRVRDGLVSEQSNLVAFPLLTPPVTFEQLQRAVDRWEARGRYRPRLEGLGALRRSVRRAQTLAARCDLTRAAKVLDSPPSSNGLLQPEATDLDVLSAKLVRRMAVFSQFTSDVNSSEFCVAP
jgi:hypothetical protein